MTAVETPAVHLATSAADEWSALVSTAVVGTDRRMPPPAAPGWQTWASAPDPAVALLDRAAAVVIARRAGARPRPGDAGALPVAPPDNRPACPAACAARLDRILAGEHEALLPEWLERCQASGVQLPWVSLPTLLLRGRRHPELDRVVRRLAGGRASWLAEVLPELGVRPTATSTSAASPPAGSPSGSSTWGPPPRPPDSGAVMSALLQVFVDGMATWAAAPQLRVIVASLDPAWLAPLIAELSRLPFQPATERTRAEVVALAEFRLAMLREFDDAGPISAAGQISATDQPSTDHSP